MSEIVKAEMQMLSIEDSKNWYNSFVHFTKEILKKDLDYGVIPNTPKPSLFKPGAEKLRFVYGLGVEFEAIERVVSFVPHPYVDYTYKCTIRSKHGQILAQCEGNCNSMETKFGFVWKTEQEIPPHIDKATLQSKSSGKKISEFSFSIDKAETSGQYGKPTEYWNMWNDAIASGKAKKITKTSKSGKSMDAYELDTTQVIYRMPNPDVVGLKNTIMKMAQKRAFVGAILLSTGASEFFTQDIEDMEINGVIYSDSVTINQQSSSDVEWEAKVSLCKSMNDLSDLYIANKEYIESNPHIKQMLTDKKEFINHQNKNHE